MKQEFRLDGRYVTDDSGVLAVLRGPVLQRWLELSWPKAEDQAAHWP